MRKTCNQNITTEPRPARSILRGKRGIGVSSPGVLLRSCRLLIAFIVMAALALLPLIVPVALLPVFPAAAQVQKEPRVGYNAALVAPDRIAEIPNVTPEE